MTQTPPDPTPDPPPSPSPPPVETQARPPDAILFLSGLGERILRQRAPDIATRIARALDFRARTETAVVRAHAIAPLRYGEKRDLEADTARIVRTDGGVETVVADLIRVPYHRVLFRQSGGSPRPLAEVMFLAMHTVSFGIRWASGLARGWRVGAAWDGFAIRKRLQLLLGGVVLAVLVTGVVLTVLAAASVPILEVARAAAEGEFLARIQPLVDAARARVYPFVALVAGLLATSRTNLKQGLHTMARQLAALSDYLDEAGYKRNEVVSEFEGVLEAVVESPERYGRVVVVGYSLGAVVALDAVHLHPRPPRRIGRVEMVVTVGAPFDVISTYWPRYFHGRSAQAPNIPWHNVYSPKDVLGSDCRLLAQTFSAPNAPQPTTNDTYPTARAQRSDIVSLAGLIAHSRYWTDDNPEHPAVWRPVAQVLFADDHPAVA